MSFDTEQISSHFFYSIIKFLVELFVEQKSLILM
jgi:hypothetical protein